MEEWFLFYINDELDKTKQSFQAGVDTLYNKCKELGFTPAGKTPTNIKDTIQKIYNDRYTNGYNAGRVQGRNDVINNPGAYGISGVITKQTSGDATTLNVSDIPGFQNFTADNFVFQIIAPSGTNGIGIGLNHVDNYDTNIGTGYVIKKQYNPSTGVFTGSIETKAILKFNQSHNINWDSIQDGNSYTYRIPAKIALIL